MKLLILSNNPDRASFRQRIGIYLDELRNQGIEPTVQKLPKTLWHRWLVFLHAQRFDAVLLQKKTLTVLDARIIRACCSCLIYDFDDAIMYKAKAPDQTVGPHRSRFIRTVKRADMVLAGNAYLAELARSFCEHVHILPTGLAISAFKNLSKSPLDARIRLVWIGSQSTLMYLNELRPVLESVGRDFSEVSLRIISDEFLDLKHMRVEKYPWSLETQARDLMSCDVGLAPLPDNHYTRGKCGFKILQYAAAGLPSIGSPVGVNIDFIAQEQNGLLAKTPEEWKEAIIHLIQNTELRRRMGQNARQFVQAYDYTSIGKKLASFISSCCENQKKRLYR